MYLQINTARVAYLFLERIVDRFFVNTNPPLIIFKNSEKGSVKPLSYTIQSNLNFNDKLKLSELRVEKAITVFDSNFVFTKGQKQSININLKGDDIKKIGETSSVNLFGGDAEGLQNSNSIMGRNEESGCRWYQIGCHLNNLWDWIVDHQGGIKTVVAIVAYVAMFCYYSSIC